MFVSCCPTVVASNLNEPYQHQSAPENYVWRYVQYSIVPDGECPSNVFKDGETELDGANEESGRRDGSTSNAISSLIKRCLWRSFIFVVLCSVVGTVAIVYHEKLRGLYNQLVSNRLSKSGDHGGNYEVVLHNGFEGVDNVPALWTRTDC